MSYRINSTGRKRLLQEHLSIQLVNTGSGRVPGFVASVTIPAEMGLDPGARIYVEPYVKSSSMRFDFGTVGRPSVPDNCFLTDIDAGADVLFRVKVVDESKEVGRILASANGVRPEGDGDGADRKPLLPLRTLDIGEELWQLSVDKDAGASLIVNSRVPGLGDRLPVDAMLQGAIYPEVVRQLVRKVYFDLREADDEQAEWMAEWKGWFAEQLGAPIDEEGISDLESVEAVGDQVVEAFSRKQRFASLAAARIAASEAQP